MSLSLAAHQVIVAMLQGLGLLAIIAIVCGTLLRRQSLALFHQATLLGAMFGAASLVIGALAQQTQGVVVDGRFIAVGLAAAFGGPAALVSAAVIGALDGPWQGSLAGIANSLGPLVVGAVGLGWRWQCAGRPTTIGSLVVLGLLCSVPIVIFHSLAANGVVLPRPMFWPLAAVASVLLTLMVGMFLEREKGMHAREKALIDASMRDPLTRLHNRRSFDAELAQTLTQPGDHYLLYVDVDHFKVINDRYGHSFGDEVLRSIARAMTENVRLDDVVARIGGEEFGIILPDIGRHGAQALAERLLKAVAACDLTAEGERVSVSVSIGAARRRQGHSASTLMGVADSALYEAKNLGRRRVAFCEAHLFDPDPLPEPANDPAGSQSAAV